MMIKKLLLMGVFAALLTVSALAVEIGVVNTPNGLKMRSEANTSSSVLVVAPDGSEVLVRVIENGWGKVEYAGKTGYMSSEYLTIERDANFDAAMTGTVTGTVVNVRASSSTSADVVCQISKGISVSVTGVRGGWYLVSYGKYTGYVHPDYLTVGVKKSESAASYEEPPVTASGETAPAVPENLSATRAQVIEYAKKFIGAKYVSGGRGPSVFDCSGYVYYVYKNFGYTLRPGASTQMDNVTAISKSELLPGDLVFFNNGSGRRASHVGIYLGDNQFIHARSPGKPLGIDTMASGYYYKYYVGAGRVLPVE